jgi:hypothetical protein
MKSIGLFRDIKNPSKNIKKFKEDCVVKDNFKKKILRSSGYRYKFEIF